MHTIKLQVEDRIYKHIMFFLRKVDARELKIIEDSMSEAQNSSQDQSETKAFSNHTANLIEDWRDSSEDEIWK